MPLSKKAMRPFKNRVKKRGGILRSVKTGNFTDDSLKQFDVILFLSTTGDILNAKQEAAFMRYIQTGGGWVGVHAAADTEYGWIWYGQLAGAYFDSHPAQAECNDSGDMRWS